MYNTTLWKLYCILRPVGNICSKRAAWLDLWFLEYGICYSACSIGGGAGDESSYVIITQKNKYDGYLVLNSKVEDGEKWVYSVDIE